MTAIVVGIIKQGDGKMAERKKSIVVKKSKSEQDLAAQARGGVATVPRPGDLPGETGKPRLHATQRLTATTQRIAEYVIDDARQTMDDLHRMEGIVKEEERKHPLALSAIRNVCIAAAIVAVIVWQGYYYLNS